MNHFTGTAVDPDLAAQRANALLESEIQSRIDAVRQLAQRQNMLEAAIAEYETAWLAAERVGWSEDKLRGIGLRSPEASPSAGRRSAVSAEQTPTAAAAVPAALPTPTPAPTPVQTIAPVVQLTPPTLAAAPAMAAPPAAPAMDSPFLGSANAAH